MSKTRIKKKVIVDVTREEAVQAFADLSKADAQNKKIMADMDLDITKIREKNQDKLEANATIIEEKTEILQTFLKLHPEVLGKKRSVELTHGTIGYRLGQYALKNKKGFTWEAVKNLVSEFISSDYVRTKEEVDKESLLADRDQPLTSIFTYEATDPIFNTPEKERPKLSSLFDKCGFTVKQDETFYVEPKKEEVLQS